MREHSASIAHYRHKAKLADGIRDGIGSSAAPKVPRLFAAYELESKGARLVNSDIEVLAKGLERAAEDRYPVDEP
jgi:hypothetical protein